MSSQRWGARGCNLKPHFLSKSFSSFLYLSYQVWAIQCRVCQFKETNWLTWSKRSQLQQYVDKPAEELTALVQPNPRKEFLTVFLETKSPLSPHFGYSLGCCNSFLGLSPLCYKLNWTQSLTLSRGQISHTGRAASVKKKKAVRCSVVAEQSL